MLKKNNEIKGDFTESQKTIINSFYQSYIDRIILQIEEGMSLKDIELSLIGYLKEEAKDITKKLINMEESLAVNIRKYL